MPICFKMQPQPVLNPTTTLDQAEAGLWQDENGDVWLKIIVGTPEVGVQAQTEVVGRFNMGPRTFTPWSSIPAGADQNLILKSQVTVYPENIVLSN